MVDTRHPPRASGQRPHKLPTYPHATYLAFENALIEILRREKTLHVTAEFLRALGYSRDPATRLLQAAGQYLAISADGQPTRWLRQLAEAPDAHLEQVALRARFEHVYAHRLGRLDIASATPEELHLALAEDIPTQSTRNKTISFLRGEAKRAGLLPQDDTASPSPSASNNVASPISPAPPGMAALSELNGFTDSERSTEDEHSLVLLMKVKNGVARVRFDVTGSTQEFDLIRQVLQTVQAWQDAITRRRPLEPVQSDVHRGMD